MSAARAIGVMILLLTPCLARAGQRDADTPPPPDPSRGDSYDGRRHEPGWRQDLTLVPRLLLAPTRLTFAALGWGTQRLLDWDERLRVHETIFAAVTSADGAIGARPAFTYAISFTPMFGLRFFDRKLLGPATDFEATVMTGGINTVYAEAYLRPTRVDRALAATVQAIYNRRQDQIFNAIGYVSDDWNKLTPGSRYAVDAVDARGAATLAAGRGLYLDLGAGFGLRRFHDGVQIGDEPPIASVYCVRRFDRLCVPGSVDEVRVPGFARGTQFFRAAATLRADSRDNWWRPSSGALVDVGVEWTHGLGFDASQYVRGHAALDAALDLWQRSHVLVVRLEAQDLEPIGYAPVPFSELVVLGGPDSFRGFRPGRSRNFSSLLAAIEYRWPIWMWMDFTAFAEYGGVFGRGFEGFAIERMRPDAGLGVRVRSSDTFFLRAQAAYGWGDGWQFFLSVNTEL